MTATKSYVEAELNHFIGFLDFYLLKAYNQFVNDNEILTDDNDMIHLSNIMNSK